MARRLQVTESDDDDTVPESKGKHAVKQEKRRTRAKIRVQDEEEEEEEQPPPPPGVEQDDEQISRGSKRRRINGDGNSIPSRAVSQEAEGEDEENVGSQAPKVEVKTQPRDTDGYIPGSIVRIKLENFVTYDAVEFRPGPYLNMIIGPNGTGKSSIACAICLGLNFPPSVLGRASEIKAFVKLGKEEGFIEIELKAPKGQRNLVIRRIIRADKKTFFTLNGKSTSGAEIRNKVAELNVQVGNLCTFLPQDKVSSFAAMSPQELLKETQLAAGDSRLTSWHSQLIKSGKEIRELKLNQNTDEAAKNQAQQRVDMMEHTVRLFNERRELEKQQAVLQCVIEVERYRVVQLRYMSVKAQHRALNEVVRKLKDKNEPVRKHLENLRVQSAQWSEEVNLGHETQRKRVAKFSNLNGQLEDLGEEIDTTYQKLEALEKEEENRLKNMRKLESDVQATEDELKKPLPKTEDPVILKAEEDQAQSDKFNLDQRHGDLKKEFKRHFDGRARASTELEHAE
ncbi:hypothetical protein AGABI2DRAFT_212089, partial [Agaricus bisporus var. bisporus H97]|uniref:hypothetical protein n=1 Tax=Agaricus bisporus var. bisporus (strain H97 / ATCC MYA-4626 / FGSC 10389) TaxID=936046 RepID=UPI00029F701C